MFKKSGDLGQALAQSKGEIHVGEFIPMGVHMTPTVVKLRENGDVCATWRLHGIPFETASPEQIGSAKRELVNFLHGIRGSEISEPCALWVHRVRRRFTDRLKGTIGHQTKKSGAELEAEFEKQAATIPAGRFGTAEEFGQVCAFLCSVPAAYLTAQNVLLDGGNYPGTF